MDLYLLILPPTPNLRRVSLMGKPQVSYSQLRLVIPPLEEPLPTLHKEGALLKLSQTLRRPKGKVRSHFSQQKGFTKTHLAVHNVKQREGESVRAFATRYIDDTLQILDLHEDQRISSFVHGLKARNLVERLTTDLPSTYKGLMEKTYTWIEAREVATNEASNDWKDNFERSRKPSRDNGMRKEERKEAKPAENPVLMINRKSYNLRKRYAEEDYNKVGEIKFPPLTKDKISADPVIIKVYVSWRQVNRNRHETNGDRGIHYPWAYTVPYAKRIWYPPLKKSSQGSEEEQKIASEARQAAKGGILSCVDAEENIMVNNRYPKQIITIRRQLPTKTKLKLQKLLKAHTDVFAWTTAHMTRVSRTIIVGEETLIQNTE
nr:reverse transcriptase domain-containing protein [Tanacetum cinerariifolium]